MNEWKDGVLSDIAEIVMGQSPAGENCSNSIIGLPLLNGPTEFTNHSPIPVQFTNDPKRESRKGDILFCVRGSTTGKMNWSDQSYAIGRGIAAIRHKSGLHLNRYIRGIIDYSLDELLQGATGSTFPNVSRTDIGNIQIEIPPLPEQERIAEVLSSLDDKIDLLQRQSKTLEEMAETLFRQWFVEEAEDSWEEKSLDQIAEYLNGLALQKFPAQKGEPSLPAIKIREMNQGITETTDRVSCNLPEKYIIENGDILFSWSGSLDVIIWTGGKGALNQHLFKVTSDKYPKWLIYFATRSFLLEFRDIANDKATTMGHIQRGHLSQSIVKLPKCEIVDKFDRIISGPFDKIIRNKLQIQHLETLRDTLLPKLMSGSVTVNELA